MSTAVVFTEIFKAAMFELKHIDKSFRDRDDFINVAQDLSCLRLKWRWCRPAGIKQILEARFIRFELAEEGTG